MKPIANAKEELSIAKIHIQNTEPAPPILKAPTTPAKFPIPTRVAVATIKECKPEKPFFAFLFLVTSLII